MKRSVRFGMLVAMLALLPAAASAQMFGRSSAPSWRGVWNPVVGTGGTYEITKKDGTKTSMDMAIVGKETVNGKDGYWFEITIADAKMGGEMIIKSLTVRDDQDMVSQKVIMQFPGRPPMEMPDRMTQARQEKQPADIRQLAEEVGPETVTTPAGTFTTTHYKMKDGSGDVWVADHAGPYGMVKFVGKDSSMVLTKVDTDVKDKITGTPQPFSPAGFGGQR
ncbi:MAG TPA: hypothetical protein VGD60_16330 [Candidatus Acidoferrales bacterium]